VTAAKFSPSDDGKAPVKAGKRSTPEREGLEWISGSNRGVRKSAGWDALVTRTKTRLADSNGRKRP
jgi:hypothetical protein